MRSASTIKIPLNQWNMLQLKANKKMNKWSAPVTVSCNYYGEIWLCINYGYHKLSTRSYLDTQELVFLTSIINLVLKHKPNGGRFHILNDRVILTHYENSQIVCFIQVNK